MYVFVSWAYRDVAAKAEEQRAMWVQSLLEKTVPTENSDEANPSEVAETPLHELLTTEFCLPEYAEFLAQQPENPLAMDELNANLLSVRFVIPQMERVITYQLSKRMPGTDKLPVSLACRSLLLNTFKGEWTGDLNNPGSNRLVFVGMPGLKEFLSELAAACAALSEPLPVDLWWDQKCIEMPSDKQLRRLVDACAFNKQGQPDQQKYQNLILGWMGAGTSAERDSNVLMATGFRMGLKGT